MKLYHWLGRWQLPGQQDKGASRIDIPNTPAEMAAWLNERRVPICLAQADPHASAVQYYGFDPTQPGSGDPAPRETEKPPVPCESPALISRPSDRADEIQNFILNEATVGEVEYIFACIGTRFAEMAKGARHGGG